MLFMWHFYLNENGTIYEVTEWAICQVTLSLCYPCCTSDSIADLQTEVALPYHGGLLALFKFVLRCVF
jgi:hypothetical protein